MKREFIYFKVFDKNWSELKLTDDDLTELENTYERISEECTGHINR